MNTNLIAILHRLLKGKPCRPLDSNLRVRISSRPIYVYPDISIVCGKPIFDADDPKQTTILNPRVVVEVLSDSTESYDRGAKFNLYRAVDSLQEYVRVSQQQPMVETFHRQGDDTWTFTAWQGIAARSHLRSLDLSIPLSEIDADADFDSASTVDASNER